MIYFVLIDLLIIEMAGRGRGRAPGEYINLPSNAGADVDAYFEYRAYGIEILSIGILISLIFIVLLAMMMKEKFSLLKNMKNIRREFYQW